MAVVVGVLIAGLVVLGLLGAALYAVFAVTRRSSDPNIKSAVDDGRVRRALDQTYQMTHGRLPAEAQARVARIREEILGLLPHLPELPLGSQDAYVVQRTAEDYLPSTIDAYLALPPGQAIQDGRMPLQVLDEQLELLDAKMKEVAEAVRQRDADRLLANGIFLEEKFGAAKELRVRDGGA